MQLSTFVKGAVPAALALGLVFACSSNNAPPVLEQSSLQQACDDMASAVCGVYRACGGLGAADLESCRLNESAYCRAQGSGTDNTQSVPEIQACAKALRGVSCEQAGRGFLETGDPLTMQTIPKECTIKPGTRPAGRVCVAHGQCASGVCGGRCRSASCARRLGVGCGVCADRVGENQDCSRALCEGGLVCDQAVSKCVKPGGAGTTCDSSASCLFGFECNPKSKKCVPANVGPAGACNDDNRCDYSIGLTCVLGACREAKYTADGESCSTDGRCTASSYCADESDGGGVSEPISDASADGAPADAGTTDAGGTKFCRRKPGERQSCKVEIGCALPSVCVDGSCVAPSTTLCN